MGLAWNTREWLAATQRGDESTGSKVEFHFLSGRQLFDSTYISVDRHHSSAGEWVILPRPLGFYSVSVVTRPVYVLPQELCLSFRCFSKEERIGKSISTGPPIEEVALEFGALLSALVREPLIPLGIRRQDNKPLSYGGLYGVLPRRPSSGKPAPAKGVSSIELAAVLRGIASASEESVRAALSAAERYHAALSISGFDLSTAYLLLVSAVETLAGHHYKEHRFDFDTVQRWRGVGDLLSKLTASGNDAVKIERIKAEILKQEYFVWQKFFKFIMDFLPAKFWHEDGPHPEGYGLPTIPPEKFKRFLREAYDARSKLAHEGIPFPSYVVLGSAGMIPSRAMMMALDLAEKAQTFVPPFAWFEKLTHHLIDEYIARIIAPEVGKQRLAGRESIEGILNKIRKLPQNALKSLEALTKWTARFLGCALMGAMAPNREWAVDIESISILKSEGFIKCDSCTWEGNATLKNRVFGEAVGEFFWDASKNPFRENEILEPAGWGDDGEPSADR